MPTVREDIAQIRQSVNSVNPDVRLPNSFIYNKLMDVTKLLVRREAEIRKIYGATEIFRTIFCVQMEETPVATCTNIFIPNCTTLSKSTLTIPKAFLTPTGSMLNVYSTDRSVKFTQTTPAKYARIADREFKGDERYFWVENDYLYIPDGIIEVMVVAMFLDNSKVDKILMPNQKCHRLLDSDSVIPDWLRLDAIRLVVESIAGVTKRIPEDENTNANSGS